MAQVTESVKLQSQTSSLMRAMDAFNEAVMLVDMGTDQWTLMFANNAWLQFMGAFSVKLPGMSLALVASKAVKHVSSTAFGRHVPQD